MWNTTDPITWKAKRDKQAYTMSFATATLAHDIGLEIYSPFTDPQFIEWAVNNTDMYDCVSDLPMELTPGPAESRVLHQTGKVCLRLAFPDSPSAYRRKDPIEIGSGFCQANLLEHFSALMPETQFYSKCMLHTDLFLYIYAHIYTHIYYITILNTIHL